MLSKGIKAGPGGKRWVIGDVHGRLDLLIKLLKKIQFGKSDTLFLIGDYVDRGPDSKGVIQFLRKLSTSYRVQPLLGNHEWMLMCAYYDPKYAAIWQEKYGRETLASFGVSSVREIPSRYILWISRLDKIIRSGNFILSHAGVNFLAKNVFQDTPDNRMGILFRDDAIPDPSGKYRSVVGHKTKTLQVCLESSESNLVFIDAGCGKKDYGKLIAFCLDDNKMIYV